MEEWHKVAQDRITRTKYDSILFNYKGTTKIDGRASDKKVYEKICSKRCKS